jgi:hypothetical protein
VNSDSEKQAARFYVFGRRAGSDAPAGLTISKHEALPSGAFAITEYWFGQNTLWFVDADKFTTDERQEAACSIFPIRDTRKPRKAKP